MLETFLSQALKISLSSLPLRVYVSTQEWEDTEPLYNEPSPSEDSVPKCKRRQRLIFVSQVTDCPDPKPSEKKESTEVATIEPQDTESKLEQRDSSISTNKNHEVYILGLSVLEYETIKKVENEEKLIKTIYIDKLDSSGYGVFPERKSVVTEGRLTVARALVQGYLNYCEKEYLGTSKEEIFLHVFARAQPQYLFAESAKNPKKQILNDKELIQWWKKSLHTISTLDSEHSKLKGYWYVPGLEDIMQKSMNPVEDNNRLSWKWGWPYNDKDKAQHVIPQFPDDAKSRLLAKEDMENITVWEFFELLSISEECGSGRRAGFFVLHLSSSKSNEATQDTCEMMSNEQFRDIEEQLFYLDFSTYEECVESTTRLSDMLVKARVKYIEIIPDEIEKLPSQESSKRKAPIDGSEVNTLSSSLIRRKGKTEPTVNVLGGSLVRKKPKTG
ncbi:hypothetical protein K7432_001246 [Basidiobolus ranarum]|uniref:histone acetyltransferase n=1 Tax=Basidiobolus ranarum TaxID=34480 RepID=A0ABR2W9W6_9FUNG